MLRRKKQKIRTENLKTFELIFDDFLDNVLYILKDIILVEMKNDFSAKELLDLFKTKLYDNNEFFNEKEKLEFVNYSRKNINDIKDCLEGIFQNNLVIKNKIFSNKELDRLLILDIKFKSNLECIINFINWTFNLKKEFPEIGKFLKKKYDLEILKFETKNNPFNDNFISINGVMYSYPNEKTFNIGRKELNIKYIEPELKNIYLDPNYQNYYVCQLLSTDVVDFIKTYNGNLQYLHNIKFILIKKDCKDYYQNIKDMGLNNIHVNSLFVSDNLFFLNEKYYIFNFLVGLEHKLYIENVLCLDSNIISDIYKIGNVSNFQMPESIKDIIKLMGDGRNWGIDLFPYCFENCLFEPSKLESSIYFNNILTFERYIHKSEEAAYSYTLKLIELQKDFILNPDKYEMIPNSLYYKRLYKNIYLSLLVMTDIQINSKKLELEIKEEIMLKYFHELGIIPEREIVLATQYFKRSNNFSFFNKIQKNKLDNIKNLKNMSWDIFHIHYVLNQHTFQAGKNSDFTLPTLLTQDNRLKDILEFYKINGLAYDLTNKNKWINYKFNNNLPTNLQNKYFSIELISERRNKINKINEEEFLNILDREILKYEYKII